MKDWDRRLEDAFESPVVPSWSLQRIGHLETTVEYSVAAAAQIENYLVLFPHQRHASALVQAWFWSTAVG